MSRSLLDLMLLTDARLARHGVHPMSDFWREAFRKWSEHPTAMRFVACAGRGSAKSTNCVAKLAVALTVFDDSFVVPPGERHFFAIISENKDEATKTLGIVKNYLTFLGIDFRPTGHDTIELADLPRGIKVMPCRVGGVSGFRCFGYALDEVAKWQVEGVSPADEVASSCAAMTITHPTARAAIVSSPMANHGYFYGEFTRGDTAHQVTVGPIASWLANPSISEAWTRSKEPDERKWRREYLCEFSSARSGAFDANAIDDAFALYRNLGNRKPSQWIVCIDPSSGRGDSWTHCGVTWATDGQARFVQLDQVHGGDLAQPRYLRCERTGAYVLANAAEPTQTQPPVLLVDWIHGVEGAFWEKTSAADLVSQVASTARKLNTRKVFADQAQDLAWRQIFRDHGLSFQSYAWGNASKRAAVDTLRRLFADRHIAIQEHPAMRRELLEFEEKISPSGVVTYEGARHDDYPALLICAMHAEKARQIPSSPLTPVPARGMGMRRIVPF